MKLKICLALSVLALLAPVLSVKAAGLSNNLKGRILLQVESKGEAWYVNPIDEKRYYMADGNAAFQIMRNFGVGITNINLDKIKTDVNYRKKFIGKIFLQVESHGEAYYISFDGRYNYLKDGPAAYEIMRKLGLGITNSDLNKIELSDKDKTVKMPNATDLVDGIIISSNRLLTATSSNVMGIVDSFEKDTIFSILSFYFTAEDAIAFKMIVIPALERDAFIGGFYGLSPADHSLLKPAIISIQYTDAAISLYKQYHPAFNESNLTLAYYDNDLFHYVKIGSDFNKAEKTVSAVIQKMYGGGIMIKETSETITENEAEIDRQKK